MCSETPCSSPSAKCLPTTDHEVTEGRICEERYGERGVADLGDPDDPYAKTQQGLESKPWTKRMQLGQESFWRRGGIALWSDWKYFSTTETSCRANYMQICRND